jgi:predicted MFS family arabinose efflux permease
MSLMYLVAALAAWLALFFFSRQWEPPVHRPAGGIPAAGWRAAWGDRAFRRLLGFCIAWAAATGVAGPFWAAHMIRHLEMSQATIAGYALCFGAANLVAQPLWGRLADRVGQRPILTVTMSIIAFLPLLWLPATRDTLGWIWLDATVSGVLWPGFNLALFNLLLGTAPRSGRSAGFALHGIGCGLAAFGAGLLGGLLAERWSGWRHPVGGVVLVNHHLLFGLTTAARLALVPLAFRLADHRALRTRAIIARAADKLNVSFAVAWRAVTRNRGPVGRPRSTADRPPRIRRG